jgi:hypothetical protein
MPLDFRPDQQFQTLDLPLVLYQKVDKNSWYFDKAINSFTEVWVK